MIEQTLPGKATWWFEKTAVTQCDSYDEAYDQLMAAMKQNPDVPRGVLNYKSLDGEHLDILVVERHRYHKRKGVWAWFAKKRRGVRSLLGRA
jgi:hypothetical protein